MQREGFVYRVLYAVCKVQYEGFVCSVYGSECMFLYAVCRVQCAGFCNPSAGFIRRGSVCSVHTV